MESILYFRAQESSDRITKVEEKYSDNDGAYQVAHGFDSNGQAIRLCNRGFAAFPNYYQTEFSAADKKRNTLKALLAKRKRQIAAAEASGNKAAFHMARIHKRIIMDKGNEAFGMGWL